MTRKIDVTQLVKDFYGGMLYIDMATKNRCCIATISYLVKKLGLERCGQRRKKGEVFSVEEKRILRGLMDTHQGRRQLLYILKRG